MNHNEERRPAIGYLEYNAAESVLEVPFESESAATRAVAFSEMPIILLGFVV